MNLMIDFETLAVSRNAAVASLGYTVFDTTTIYDNGGWVINTASSILAGGVVDQGTVDWWKTQDVEAQRAISNGGVAITDVMMQLAEIWNDRKCNLIWSHGATFDIPIAEFYFQGHEPWKYSAHRDTRTLFDVAKMKGWVKPERITTHVASKDALDQAEDVIAALAHLRVM